MKNIHKIKQALLLMMVAALSSVTTLNAQCYETLGSSPNMFTSLLARTNQLVVNNELNSLVFIHRNDISVFGGDNGVYRYDISTDNGATWQLNQGTLNPGSTLGTNGGRYPQVGIYNPTGNTNLQNASLVYHGPTNGGGLWNGYVTGVQSLNGSSPSTENYNQAGATNTNLPGGLCQSVPGTFWTIDAMYSSSAFDFTGIRILKGIYGAGNINWSVQKEDILDFNRDYFGTAGVGDYNMAFDPSGQYGWAVISTHLNPSTDFNFHPVLYNTTDGGNTWNGPLQLELNSISGITDVEAFPAMYYDIDITVDMNGRPHILLGVFDGSVGYPYYLSYERPGNLFDLTNDGSGWNANHIARFMYTRQFDNIGINSFRPQISRSDDGTVLAFTWIETEGPQLYGNLSPNIKTIVRDVATGNSSCVMSYPLICSSDLDGLMYQTTVSPNLLEVNSTYTVPVMLTVLNISGSADDPSQHYYLNQLTFTKSVINEQPPVVPAITVNGNPTLCQGTTVELTASASSSYLWNTGETTQSITVAGGLYWVVNTNNNYCVTNDNSVFIEEIFSPGIYSYGSTYLCNGESVELFVYYYSSGNDILWSTGETTPSIMVNTSGLYSVTVDGCETIYPAEVIATDNTYRLGITASGPTTLCYGEMVTLTADASNNYLWTTGETTQSIDVYAYYSDLYAVVNPDSNYCIDASNSIFIETIYPPDLYASDNIICGGNPVEIYVYYYGPGNDILWSTGETTEMISVSTPGLYSVTVDGCESLYQLELIAKATPANDNICNAQSLVIGAVTAFDNTCATAEPGEPVPPMVGFSDTGSQDGWLDEYGNGPVVERSVWFSFIAPNSKAVNITSSFDEWSHDTQLALYSSSNYSCTGTLTLIAASDDVDTDNGDWSSFINRAYCLQPGKKYFVQIDGYAEMRGAGTVQVRAVPNRVTVCHRTASGSSMPLVISGCALAGHLGHGDIIGNCPGVRTIATVEEDEMALTFVAHPNPTSGELNISFTSNDDESYSLTVVDVTGRTVIAENRTATTGLNSSIIDLKKVMPGIYFLVVRKGDNMLQTKIIKE